jgi:hypothetical protein
LASLITCHSPSSPVEVAGRLVGCGGGDTRAKVDYYTSYAHTNSLLARRYMRVLRVCGSIKLGPGGTKCTQLKRIHVNLARLDKVSPPSSAGWPAGGRLCARWNATRARQIFMRPKLEPTRSRAQNNEVLLRMRVPVSCKSKSVLAYPAADKRRQRATPFSEPTGWRA